MPAFELDLGHWSIFFFLFSVKSYTLKMSSPKENNHEEKEKLNLKPEKKTKEEQVDNKQEHDQSEASSLWTPVWDDNAQAYYWWHTETNETTWINPAEPIAETGATENSATAVTEAPANNPLDFLLDRIDNVVKKKLDGQEDQTVNEGYQEHYAQYYTNNDPYYQQEERYTAQAHFNARTGRFTTQADVDRLNPDHLSIHARAKRQMQNYFDVDSYTEQRNAQRNMIEEGRVNKKKPLTRKEVEYFKKMKKEKKSKRAREWLMQ
jgi:hypothetical protein